MVAKFEDSSHQLWHCETVDGPMVLKLCNHQTVETSTFWRGMNQLFAINFPASLAYIDKTHDFVSEHGELQIPEFIASEASVFVLARYVDGEDVDVEHVSDDMVIQLANHLAKLHQSKRSHWGAFHNAEFLSEQWPIKLQQPIKTLAKNYSSSIAEPILQQALQQAAQLKLDTFSPIMLDLRWDQMLHQQGKLSAIVDMDAFVIGPRELELVLLEYQLSQHQADIFKQSYQAKTDWPDLTQQRYCYRVLLFLMNSLGETNIEKWMNAEIRWR
ncbi:hypothetical protein LCGC14_1594930 [marine sediment metagenome]|uniref:Aminoglycoside phosphotransferase domain-containing protein n=1 Tax=marine sediment metagenome TaxID=412755 RepID=A0A0F9LD97_9ZZZZ